MRRVFVKDGAYEPLVESPSMPTGELWFVQQELLLEGIRTMKTTNVI